MLATHLAVLPIFDILLSVEEPVWDLVLARILHDGHHTLHLDTRAHSSPNVPLPRSRLRQLVPTAEACRLWNSDEVEKQSWGLLATLTRPLATEPSAAGVSLCRAWRFTSPSRPQVTLLTSSSVSSPALLLRSISAFLSTTWA